MDGALYKPVAWVRALTSMNCVVHREMQALTLSAPFQSPPTTQIPTVGENT